MKKLLYILMLMCMVVSCVDDANDATMDRLPEGVVNFSIENLKLDNGAIDTFRFVLTNTSQLPAEIEDYSFAWEIEGKPGIVVGKAKDTVLVKKQGTYDVTLTVVSDRKTGQLTQQLIQAKTYTGMSDASLELFNLLTNNGAAQGQAWVLDPTVIGFLGSGPAGADNYSRWWDAPVGGKDGAEIMDDEFIFFANGSYEVDTHGKTQVQNVQVLKDRSYYSILNETQYDLNMAVDDDARQGYKFKIEENEAGMPIAIQLSSEHVCIGYDDENTHRRYELLDDQDGDPKTLFLRILSEKENRYCRIIPKGYEPVREEPEPRDVISPEDLALLLHGNDEANGRTWVLDPSQNGHLGIIGWAPKYENLLDPSKWWWHAQPNEKEGANLYDDEYTFFPDGTYRIVTHGVTTSMAVDAGLAAGYYTAAASGDGERAVFVDDAARTGHTYAIETSVDEDGNKYIYIQLSSPDVCIGFDDDHFDRKYEVFAFTEGEAQTLFIGNLHPNKPVYRFNKLIVK